MIEKIKKNLVTIIMASAILILFILYIIKPSSSKMAYIETNEIFMKYEGMKDARAEYEKKAAAWKANTDTLIKGWQEELKTYEKERNRMSAKERQLKEELLTNKQQQISNYQEATQKKAKDEEQKMMQTVLNVVNEYVQKYGKKHGFKYILGANGSGSILYADKAYNITEEVLEGLNKEYKK